MARKTRQLGVWTGTEQVGVLEPRNRYELACIQTDVASERRRVSAPVIPCQLPLSDQRADAIAFSRGLLPEGNALEATARQGHRQAGEGVGGC